MRQTTLARKLIGGERRCLNLDDKTTPLAGQTDPTGMVRELDRAIIEEVQLAPEPLRVIKKSIDNDLHPGRFLLTHRLGGHCDTAEGFCESRGTPVGDHALAQWPRV